MRRESFTIPGDRSQYGALQPVQGKEFSVAKAIMIQGTMSGAGKSLLAAGLCRIFRQDGYKVAPFKSQNMALNSFITEEGLEMGRAQVMQAEACGIAPSVRMNPILLKPTNDTGSQVIVNGEVLGNYSARDYFSFKKKLIPEIMRAYRSLDEEYDIIVLEGAGSPAEINLKKDDIVNMGMAELAHAPVLLAGDIDRGGVFAQLYGTVALLEKKERALVKGLIINKFRGDRTILDPGVEMLEELTGIPVVGVTPYLSVDLEDEDSLSGRFAPAAEKRPLITGTCAGGESVRQDPEAGEGKVPVLDLAVIRLPKISNFTDFNPFEYVEGVSVRYVDRPSRLGVPDLIFLPGSKNTMGDLRWLRESGMEAALLKAHAAGSAVFGVCGGYQMLGQTLSDPLGVESGGQMRGLGLLPLSTVFSGAKTRSRVHGYFGETGGLFRGLAGKEFEGYEIHMGRTERTGGDSFLQFSESHGNGPGESRSGGCVCGDVCGSYIHGLFDLAGVREAIVSALCERRGIRPSDVRTVDYRTYKEAQYVKLAEGLRESLDMKRIYEILWKGIA